MTITNMIIINVSIIITTVSDLFVDFANISMTIIVMILVNFGIIIATVCVRFVCHDHHYFSIMIIRFCMLVIMTMTTNNQQEQDVFLSLLTGLQKTL